ncbi:MAG: GNAT family N-acetyltransferase [Muribaculaceae bacterium]|nr:GNAT family N-acetyltransferase [Muribaculaceae bacterium]
MEPEDAEFMFEAENEEAAWIYSDYLAPLSMEMLRQYAMTYDADPLRSGQLRLVVDVDGRPVGMADIFDISARHLHAMTGIYILPDMRSKGVGAEALRLLCEYCRTRLGMHILCAIIAERNQAARKCYRSAGFIASGILPQWLREGDYYNNAIFMVRKIDINEQRYLNN